MDTLALNIFSYDIIVKYKSEFVYYYLPTNACETLSMLLKGGRLPTTMAPPASRSLLKPAWRCLSTQSKTRHPLNAPRFLSSEIYKNTWNEKCFLWSRNWTTNAASCDHYTAIPTCLCSLSFNLHRLAANASLLGCSPGTSVPHSWGSSSTKYPACLLSSR